MATNYVQRGDSLDLTAPAGGLTSGQGHVFGSLFAIALTDIAAGEKGTCATTGVFSLPKASGEAFTEGAPAYWDGSKITATATGNTLIGHVVEAAATSATSARVLI